MRIHVFQHDPIVGYANIASWAQQHHATLTTTRVDMTQVFPALDSYDLLIVLGGRMGAYEEDTYPWLKIEKEYIRQAVKADKFVLGICLGSQLVASALGGKAYQHTQVEVGWHTVRFNEVARKHPLLRSIPEEGRFFEFHFDTFQLPEHACLLGTSACANQAYAIGNRTLAIQFHPEFDEEAIDYIVNTNYPHSVNSPYLQPLTELKNTANHDESRTFIFHVLDNFQEEITKSKLDLKPNP
ncbi:type 1 glutamine amidotransferase [Radiobacillus deserti]|uniref:Type 1 glutamine amidotransferase n=1 Tax=Radiobacillus deserti TaxID=2594883 RepID=A0A516KEK1_9BACI|nr:type 1 glutamine amidotransferase [Radiobacillus deserti]QDP39819.1 type 1 glutamine amidotransferase [Radiobacillus deserti]